MVHMFKLKGNSWKVSLECGGKTTTLEVTPEISQEALFQRLAEKAGVAKASSMVLYQFDDDLGDWAKVDAEEVEPADEAKFRVEKSASGGNAASPMEAATAVPPKVRISCYSGVGQEDEKYQGGQYRDQ